MSFEKLFSIKLSMRYIVFRFFGIKISFSRSFLYWMCNDIENLNHIKQQGTILIHPVGVVIHKNVCLGKRCIIRQNVTLGRGKYNEAYGRDYPILGDNVQIGANAVIIGGINVGDNAYIGAGAVVVKDVPANAVVAGVPAKIIKYWEPKDEIIYYSTSNNHLQP